MEKLIVVVAPVGAETTRTQNPGLPITAAEIGKEVRDCEDAGASVVHLHVRTPNGTPTQCPEVFREAIEAILSRGCQSILQVSTGGSTGMTPEERLQALEAHERVEMASLTTGTCNFGDGVFQNRKSLVEQFAGAIRKRCVKPELECFELGFIENASRLLRNGLVDEPAHFNFVLGVPGAAPATLPTLLAMVQSLPSVRSTWQVTGIGRHQLPMAVHALLMGGHVRVGFEDNSYYCQGRLARSNAELVERIVRVARELGREVASPEEARRILQMPPRPSL
jgi:3-keto-5-aminohexanoate cleavage enzyme